MTLVQYMWYNSTLPRELSYTILVLLPKLNTDTRWIDLIKFLCKFVETIINTMVKTTVQFLDVLHGFYAC